MISYLKQTAKRKHADIVTIKSFLGMELISPIKVNPIRRIKLLKKGFLSEAHVLYNLAENDLSLYLSDVSRLNTRFINGNYSMILSNKLIFESAMNNFLDIPKSFGLIETGEFVPFYDSSTKQDKHENGELLWELLNTQGRLVLKPITGGGGYGVLIIAITNQNELYLNKHKIDKSQLLLYISSLKNYLVTECVQQGHYSSNIFPSSINTIRLITMIHPKTHRAFIPVAVHRFGNKKTAPSDNWTQGGYSALIDLNSGVLGRAAAYPVNGKLSWYEAHPETHAQLEGTKIPHWDHIKHTILSAANNFPCLKYVGWDIVVTDHGFKVLEGNNFSDVNLLQIHRPLLQNEQEKEFYHKHNIIAT